MVPHFFWSELKQLTLVNNCVLHGTVDYQLLADRLRFISFSVANKFPLNLCRTLWGAK